MHIKSQIKIVSKVVESGAERGYPIVHAGQSLRNGSL
jgi:hypothetical protein